MANLAYRSVVGATNWSTTTSWNVYSLPASGGVFPGGGTWGAASDYPKTGDYVWISSTASVTYDATAISTNNSATFAQISNNIASNGSAVAQPGTGGANATTGTISLSVASTTTINATYYNIASGTAGLFSITTSNTTFNFTGTWYEGTTGSWLLAPSGSNNTINITGNIKSSGTSGTGISLTNVNTLNIIGDVTCRAGSTIVAAAANTAINVTGNVYGSDTSTAYAIQNGNTTTNTTITGNVYSGVNAVAIYTPVTSTLTVTGNIRNYGSTGSSAYSAYICPQIFIRSSSTQQFRTSDAGVKDFTTSGATTVTEASIWAYLTSSITTSGSIGKLLKDNIDATISTRLASSGYTTPPTVTAIRTEMDTNSTKLANLDTTVSSRLATSGYTAPDNTSITAIKAKTDNLPSNPASQTNLDVAVSTRLATSGYTAPDNTSITAIKAKTDNLPSDPASNTQVNTRLASVDYTAPPSVNDIKTATSTQVILDLDSASTANIAKRLREVSTVATTGDQLASYNT